MEIWEITTKNGRTFRVAIMSKNQKKKLLKIIAENKKKSYETFEHIKCIKNDIRNIKDFEATANSLI